jgi:hypothetical protein
MAIAVLEGGRWRRRAAGVEVALDQFKALYAERYETEA